MLLGLYEEYGNAVQVAMFYRTEEDMRAFLAHPRSVVGSDGVEVVSEGAWNGRAAGRMPRRSEPG